MAHPRWTTENPLNFAANTIIETNGICFKILTQLIAKSRNKEEIKEIRRIAFVKMIGREQLKATMI